MYTKILLSTLLFGLSTIALADVTITADDDIKITAINGQAVNTGFLSTPKQSFTLPAGQTVITARYDRLFNLNRQDHEVIKSPEITLSANLADNQTYRLTMPNLPTTHSQAEEFIKSPTLQLLSDGQVIASESKTTTSSPLFGGFSLGGLFGKKDTLAEHHKAMASAHTPQPPATPPTAQIAPKLDTLDEFMKLWLNANESEREKIRQWVNK